MGVPVLTKCLPSHVKAQRKNKTKQIVGPAEAQQVGVPGGLPQRVGRLWVCFAGVSVGSPVCVWMNQNIKFFQCLTRPPWV